LKEEVVPFLSWKHVELGDGKNHVEPFDQNDCLLGQRFLANLKKTTLYQFIT